jgi:hypothetical protein
MNMFYKYIVTGTDTSYESPTFRKVTVFGKFTSLEAARGHLMWEVNEYMEKYDDESVGDIYTGGTYNDGEILVAGTFHTGPNDGKGFGMRFKIEEIEPEKVELE